MINISTLAEKVGGSIEGDSTLVISGVGDIKSSPKDFLTFLSDNRYHDDLLESKSEAVIVNHEFLNDNLNKTLIRVDNPVYAYIQILEFFDQPKKIDVGIHPTAIISKKASIGKDVYIGPYVVIGNQALTTNAL